MKIAITGIAGRFGRLLAGLLHRNHEVVGIDRRPCRTVPKDVEVHCIDIRRKRCEAIFRQNRFDAVVHLQVLHNPRASSAEHYSFNIQGTDRVMSHCVKHGVKKLVLLSSANVYGPRPDNTQFLGEDTPLMGGERFSEIRDLVGVDMLGQSFFWKYPQVETVILRPVHIIGLVRNAPSNYLRLLRPWTLAGFDPVVQVIHENDTALAVEHALEPGIQGIFNVPGCEPAPLSQLHRLAECKPIAVPHLVAGPMLNRLFKMRLTTFPAPELDHLRYLCMVDGQRARSTLGFNPQHDLADTMAHLRLTRLLQH
ncbi:MAG: NAD-dependent epimerase [Myxococcales bacterium]|nr:NAD-dependent epimerase [Myxococcales bacterium]